MTTIHHPQAPASGGVLAPVLFTLRTKGPAGLAKRVATVATRFGPTPQPIVRRLERMIDVAASAGFQPTCPITATVLVRHPDVIRELADRGMEIAVHGLRHNDHRALDVKTQQREVAQAVAVFARCGITPTGFRAPYLRADDATRAAVRAAGLTYQSDDAVVFPTSVPGSLHDDGYVRAIDMYDAQDATRKACRPRLVDDLVQIPVCVPDDEMLIDRLHLDEYACANEWSAIMDATHERGDLFTMQVHPERFGGSANAVDAVMSRAQELGDVWAARLDQIAGWWRARAACAVDVSPHDDGTVTYSVQGDDRARLRLVGADHGVPLHPVRVATPQPTRGPAQNVTVSGARLPLVAIGRGVPESVISFLREDGFVLTTEPSAPCAVELSGWLDEHDQMALRRRVLSAAHPVLMIDRWPSGRTSALALTGDIDALTAQDFARRIWDNTHGAPAWVTGATS